MEFSVDEIIRNIFFCWFRKKNHSRSRSNSNNNHECGACEQEADGAKQTSGKKSKISNNRFTWTASRTQWLYYRKLNKIVCLLFSFHVCALFLVAQHLPLRPSSTIAKSLSLRWIWILHSRFVKVFFPLSNFFVMFWFFFASSSSFVQVYFMAHFFARISPGKVFRSFVMCLLYTRYKTIQYTDKTV